MRIFLDFGELKIKAFDTTHVAIYHRKKHVITYLTWC